MLATLESLRGLLGTIHVEVNTEAEVWLGDRIVGTAPGDVLVRGDATRSSSGPRAGSPSGGRSRSRPASAWSSR